jgi:mycothiol system anti-sigma-R factor
MTGDMDCADCLERLYPYLDKELSAEEVVVVRRHLDDCHDCGRHFVFEERFIQRIRDICSGDRAPAHLREQIVLRLRTR